jgi:hypothetical protein
MRVWVHVCSQLPICSTLDCECSHIGFTLSHLEEPSDNTIRGREFAKAMPHLQQASAWPYQIRQRYCLKRARPIAEHLWILAVTPCNLKFPCQFYQKNPMTAFECSLTCSYACLRLTGVSEPLEKAGMSLYCTLPLHQGVFEYIAGISYYTPRLNVYGRKGQVSKLRPAAARIYAQQSGSRSFPALDDAPWSNHTTGYGDLQNCLTDMSGMCTSRCPLTSQHLVSRVVRSLSVTGRVSVQLLHTHVKQFCNTLNIQYKRLCR